MQFKATRYILAAFISLGLIAIGWTWVTLHWSYSQGERAGYVQKLSNKGWLCKTWEGELAMVTMPGAIPEKFYFTVRDDEVARDINGLAGKRVVLYYKQHKFIPSSCFGDTEYFIEQVTEVADAPTVPMDPTVPQGKLLAPR